MVRSESEYYGIEAFFHAFYCVEDAYGVIHRAERIHLYAELVTFATSSYMVGKARTYEQYALAGFEFPIGRININRCSEVHNDISFCSLAARCR